MCAMRAGTLKSDRNQCDPLSDPPLPQTSPPTRRLYAGDTCASLLSSGAPLAHALPKQSCLGGSASRLRCIRGGKHGSVWEVGVGGRKGPPGGAATITRQGARGKRRRPDAGVTDLPR